MVIAGLQDGVSSVHACYEHRLKSPTRNQPMGIMPPTHRFMTQRLGFVLLLAALCDSIQLSESGEDGILGFISDDKVSDAVLHIAKSAAGKGTGAELMGVILPSDSSAEGAPTQDAAESPTGDRSFVIENDEFVKDGQTFNLRSGSLHYFRVPPAYWRDRMLRMKAMGLNSVTMYVAWNWHEAEEGRIDGVGNVTAFLSVAQSVGMLVIFRPGP